MKEDLFFDVALEHMLHLYVALTEIHTTSGLQTFQSDTEHADNLQLGLKYLGMILQDVIEDIDSAQVDASPILLEEFDGLVEVVVTATLLDVV